MSGAFGLGLSPLDGGRLAASLGGEPRLPLALLLLEHGDLLAHRVVERPPLGEALLDLVTSRGALGDDLTLPGKGALDRLALPLDLGFGATDLIEDASVVFRHSAGRVEAVEQVVEAGRAEHDLDDVDLAALVELDEPLVDGDRARRRLAFAISRRCLLSGELALELLQAQVGAVPRLDRELELHVQLVDLREHLLGLRRASRRSRPDPPPPPRRGRASRRGRERAS